MRKKAAQVEWLFPAEDEYEQVITAPQDISPAARSAQRTRRLLWLAALLIPLSATLAALYRSAQQGVDALVPSGGFTSRTPLASRAASISSERCSEAVGAATEPGLAANTV